MRASIRDFLMIGRQVRGTLLSFRANLISVSPIFFTILGRLRSCVWLRRLLRIVTVLVDAEGDDTADFISESLSRRSLLVDSIEERRVKLVA